MAFGGFGSFLAGIAGTVTKRALAGIGVGIVSYAAVTTALQQALSSAKAAWSGFAGEALQLVQMAGVTQFLSIVAGGLLASVAITALKKFEVR
jgi:ABC-type Co2+ transport system permease subunit